ncbi:MAG: hypothetical protein RIB97_01030 [Nitratireductor sp.]
MTVLAGDYKKDCDVRFAGDRLQIQKGIFSFEHINVADTSSFEVVTEENRASILGKVGWGAVGALALGPLGLLAGVIGGGNRRDRVMLIETRDGKRLLLKGGAKDVEKFTATTFNNHTRKVRTIEWHAAERIDPPME